MKIQLFILWLICLSHPANCVFMQVGRVASGTSFAHLVTRINVKDVLESHDKLEEMVEAVTRISTTADSQPIKNEHYSVRRSLNNLKTIWDMAQSRDQTPPSYSKVNDFYETVVRDHSDRGNNPVSTTMNPLETPNVRSGRSLETFEQLVTFALQIFSPSQLEKIVDYATRPLSNDVKVIAEAVAESSLTIANVTRHVQENRDYLLEVNRQNKQTSLDLKISSMRNVILLVQNNFRHECDNFAMGISTLIEGRLSPLLIDQEALKTSYQSIVKRAREQSLQPVSEQYGIIFSSKTSIVGTTDGDLIAVTHIPLYSGSLLPLFVHIPAPQFFDNTSIALKVTSEKSHIAIDSTSNLAKEYTDSDLSACLKLGELLHCPYENMLQKNVESLCLWNLFHESRSGIEETCQVEVDILKHSHAVQVGPNKFRITTKEPMRLYQDCGPNQEPKISTIQGVYLLNLTEECPKASTADYYFSQNRRIIEYLNVIQLPTSQETQHWLDLDTEELQRKLPQILEDIRVEGLEKLTIQGLRKRMEAIGRDDVWSKLGLVQLVLVLTLTLGVAGMVLYRIYRKCARCCCCNVQMDNSDCRNDVQPGAPVVIASAPRMENMSEAPMTPRTWRRFVQ